MIVFEALGKTRRWLCWLILGDLIYWHFSGEIGEVQEAIDHNSWLALKNLVGNTTEPGFAVARLVEALHYNPEVCGFDSRWDSSLT
jgi:hypothetical protein